MDVAVEVEVMDVEAEDTDVAAVFFVSAVLVVPRLGAL